MVRTLIKHEVLRTGPMMGLILGVGTLVLLGSGFLTHLNIPVVSAVFGVFGLFLVGGMWPLSQLALAVDFWRTSWGRMGYLTHSLPVRGSAILGARLVWGAAVQVIALAWTVLASLAMAYLGGPVFQGDGPAMEEAIPRFLASLGELLPWWQWVLVVLLALFLGWFYLVMFYFAATIGSDPKLAGLGVVGPILTWIASYLVTSILCFGAIFLPIGLTYAGGGLDLGLVDTLHAYQMKENNIIPLGWVVAMVMLVAACIPWMVHNWNRRISLR